MGNGAECSRNYVKGKFRGRKKNNNNLGTNKNLRTKKKKIQQITNTKAIVSSCARKMRTFEPLGALFNPFLSKLVFVLPIGGQQS